MAGFAEALTIMDLDTGGLVGGTWVIQNDAVVTGSSADYQIKVGTDNWGAAMGDGQTSHWHAAGLQLPSNTGGYTVQFDYDLYTWDSYSMDQSVGNQGWWDNLGVSLNEADFLWNQTLQDPDSTHGGTWPGVMWSWGGITYPLYDHTMGSTSITGGGADIYLTVFCSTGVYPDHDGIYPSWGGFNIDAAPPDEGVIPEPATFALLLMGLGALAGVRRRRKVTS